jgi:hypothetical protein
VSELKFASPNNFNFENGSVVTIPENSIALAFLSSVLPLRKFTNKIVNLFDYLDFRKALVESSVDDFLNFREIFLAHDSKIVIGTSNIASNLLNTPIANVESAFKTNMPSGVLPSADNVVFFNSSNDHFSDSISVPPLLSQNPASIPPCAFVLTNLSADEVVATTTTPTITTTSTTTSLPSIILDEPYTVVPTRTTPTKLLFLHQLSESLKMEVLTVVKSCINLADSTGRVGTNWSHARELVLGKFPQIHRYAANDSFKEAMSKLLAVPVMENVSSISTKKVFSPLLRSSSESSSSFTSTPVKVPISSSNVTHNLFYDTSNGKRDRQFSSSPKEPAYKKSSVSASAVVTEFTSNILVLGISKNVSDVERNCSITASSYITLSSTCADMLVLCDIYTYFNSAPNQLDDVLAAVKTVLLRLSLLLKARRNVDLCNSSHKICIVTQNTSVYNLLSTFGLSDDIHARSINIIHSLVLSLKEHLCTVTFSLDSESPAFDSLLTKSLDAIKKRTPYPIFPLNGIPLQNSAPVSGELSVLSPRMATLNKLLSVESAHIDYMTPSYNQGCLFYAMLKSPYYYDLDQVPLYVLSINSFCINLAHFFMEAYKWMEIPSSFFRFDDPSVEVESLSSSMNLISRALPRLLQSEYGLDLELNTTLLKMLSFFCGLNIRVYNVCESESNPSLIFQEYNVSEYNVPDSFYVDLGPWTLSQDASPRMVDPQFLNLALDRAHYYHIYHSPLIIIDDDSEPSTSV